MLNDAYYAYCNRYHKMHSVLPYVPDCISEAENAISLSFIENHNNIVIF